MFKGLCRKCRKQGHKAVDCRSEPKEGPKKGIKCYNCNKYAGHIAKDCPKPKKQRPFNRSAPQERPAENGMFVGTHEVEDYEMVEYTGFCINSDNDFSEIDYGDEPSDSDEYEVVPYDSQAEYLDEEDLTILDDDSTIQVVDKVEDKDLATPKNSTVDDSDSHKKNISTYFCFQQG